MQMRRDGHPVASVSTARRLTHLSNPLTADYRTRDADLSKVGVKCEKLLSTGRPSVLNDDVPAEVRRVLVVHNFHDPSIEHAEYVVMRHEGGFFAFKIGIRGAVRKDDPRRLACRRNFDRRDVTPAVKPLPAVTRPTRQAVLRVNARACEKPFRRVE